MKIDITLVIAFFGLVIAIIASRRQIYHFLAFTKIDKPLYISIRKAYPPMDAIIQSPDEKRSFEFYQKKNRLYHKIDIYGIEVINKTDIPITITPVIFIDVIRIKQIDTIPVIFKPAPDTLPMGGGGDYDLFNVNIEPRVDKYSANLVSKRSDYFEIKPDELEVFVIEVKHPEGYMAWYKFGLEYSFNGNKRIIWKNKLFFGGNPILCRKWMFKQQLKKATILIKTEEYHSQLDTSAPAVEGLEISKPEDYSSQEQGNLFFYCQDIINNEVIAKKSIDIKIRLENPSLVIKIQQNKPQYFLFDYQKSERLIIVDNPESKNVIGTVINKYKDLGISDNVFNQVVFGLFFDTARIEENIHKVEGVSLSENRIQSDFEKWINIPDTNLSIGYG